MLLGATLVIDVAWLLPNYCLLLLDLHPSEILLETVLLRLHLFHVVFVITVGLILRAYLVDRPN